MSRQKIVSLLKWAIFLVTVAALLAASRQAIGQWQRESQRLVEAAEQLTGRIDQAPDEATRQALVRQRDAVLESIPSLGNLQWRWIAAAALAYALGLLPPAVVLCQTAGAFGVRRPLSQCLGAQLLGHAGKYVPGKAVVVVLRVWGLGDRAGHAQLVSAEQDEVAETTEEIAEAAEELTHHVYVAPDKPTATPPAADETSDGSTNLQPNGWVAPATTSVFLETLLMMSVGGTIAGVLLWSFPIPWWIKAAAGGMAVAAAVPTLPPVMRRLLKLLSVIRKQHGRGSTDDSAITWTLMARSWLWSAVSWGLIGASFWLLILAIPAGAGSPAPPPFVSANGDDQPTNRWVSPSPQPSLNAAGSASLSLYLVATAAISLGMVLGFASLVPGGAGIREYVTLLVLTPSVGATTALLAVIAARLMFVVVESTLAAVSYVWLKTTKS